MNLTANRIAGILREKGYKLTPQRHAVLLVIADSHNHLTPEAIHKRVSRKNPKIGLVTVYRTLNLFSELGLVCKVHTGNCRSYLMRRPTEHHHHLVCSTCGGVIDFIGCDLSELERRLSREKGFEIQSHLLEFRGQCRLCRKITSD